MEKVINWSYHVTSKGEKCLLGQKTFLQKGQRLNREKIPCFLFINSNENPWIGVTRVILCWMKATEQGGSTLTRHPAEDTGAATDGYESVEKVQ